MNEYFLILQLKHLSFCKTSTLYFKEVQFRQTSSHSATGAAFRKKQGATEQKCNVTFLGTIVRRSGETF